MEMCENSNAVPSMSLHVQNNNQSFIITHIYTAMATSDWANSEIYAHAK